MRPASRGLPAESHKAPPARRPRRTQPGATNGACFAFQLELGIYAVGRIELAELFPNEDLSVGSQLIEAKIFIVYQRQLCNLSIQESPLCQREKKTASLRQLQDDRKRKAKARLNKAARQYIVAVQEDRHDDWEPAANGFEFSLGTNRGPRPGFEPDLFAEYEALMAEQARKPPDTGRKEIDAAHL